MRRVRLISASMSLLALAVPAVLVLGAPVSAGEPYQPTAGGWESGTLSYESTVPLEAGTAIDAVLHEQHLYVTAWRSFSIYDVSAPLEPELVSVTPLPPTLFNEQPQTNGEILLISRDFGTFNGQGGTLEIYDVSDKAAPRKIATHQNTRGDHIWTCVLDCAYLYSSSGTILDLRDPSAPVEIGDWSKVAPPVGMHAIDEVAPGLVLTGSTPMYYLDARDDPANPEVLATVAVPTTTAPAFGISKRESKPARVDWPREAQDAFALVTMETPFSGRCSDQSGGLYTFDTRGWRNTGTFRFVDEYQISENGTYTDGAPPYNVFGCSSFGMDARPGYRAGDRQVAVAFLEHGVRLLDVDQRGEITELGGFVPTAGNSSAPVWVADDVLYLIDLQRGIDILRVDEAPDRRE